MNQALQAPVRMRYEVELSYQVRTTGADFIFNVQAARTPRQQVLWESLTTSQFVPMTEYCDAATAGRFLRLRAGAGALTLRYAAVVELHHHRQAPNDIPEVWIPNLPGEALPYLYPSRYCESDKLNAFAMSQFGSLWQGYARAQAICEWVQNNVMFESGSSCGTTSAADTLLARRGV